MLLVWVTVISPAPEIFNTLTFVASISKVFSPVATTFKVLVVPAVLTKLISELFKFNANVLSTVELTTATSAPLTASVTLIVAIALPVIVVSPALFKVTVVRVLLKVEASVISFPV